MSETDGSVKSKSQLQEEGWTQASLTGGHHLERTVEMYRELGLEIYLEEIDPKECGQCTSCFEEGKEKMFRIYTR